MFVVKLSQVFLLYLMAKVVFVKRSSIILSSDSGIVVLKISISFLLFMVSKADDRSMLVIFIVHPDLTLSSSAIL